MPDPTSQSFWDDAETQLVDDLTELLLDTYLDGIDGGANAMPNNLRSLVNFDVVNKSALDFAKQYRYKWIKEITDTTREQVQQAISDWIQSGASLPALDKTLEPIFGADRADMIAATEVTRVFAQANMDLWESTGMVSSATWMTSKDESVCPECDANDGMEVGIGDLDAAPPAHPNCRCWLQPNVNLDLVQKALEEA